VFLGSWFRLGCFVAAGSGAGAGRGERRTDVLRGWDGISVVAGLRWGLLTTAEGFRSLAVALGGGPEARGALSACVRGSALIVERGCARHNAERENVKMD
jgi:hypothetical protein